MKTEERKVCEKCRKESRGLRMVWSVGRYALWCAGCRSLAGWGQRWA